MQNFLEVTLRQTQQIQVQLQVQPGTKGALIPLKYLPETLFVPMPQFGYTNSVLPHIVRRERVQPPERCW